MRITKNQLQGLINEEISRALLRSENRRLVEALVDTGHGSLYDIDVVELIDFAKSYASLGAAVQEQLDDLLDQQEDAEVNGNAVSMIQDRLGGMSAEVDEAVAAWLDARGEE